MRVQGQHISPPVCLADSHVCVSRLMVEGASEVRRLLLEGASEAIGCLGEPISEQHIEP